MREQLFEDGDGYRVAADDAVVRVTLNLPDRANALGAGDCRRLTAMFREINALPAGTVRAVLLRAEGKHFCAGADIGGPRDSERPRTSHMLRRLADGAHGTVQALWDCNVPVVAAVQGRAAGLGANLAFASDFVVAAADASFSEPFVERGFSADSGSTWLLPRLVGVARAKELLLRGLLVDADRAERWGLVSEVVPAEQLEDRADALVRELAAAATVAVGLTKQLVHRHLTSSLATALEDQAFAVEVSIRSDDFKEGMRAFVNRERPHFTGH